MSNTDTLVYDVSDKANPALVGRLAGVDQHTMRCVLDCTWVYGSEGAIIDLRDPTEPKLAGKWNDAVGVALESTHDVTEVAPGIVVTSTQPFLVLDARQDPSTPTVLAPARHRGSCTGTCGRRWAPTTSCSSAARPSAPGARTARRPRS